MDLIVVISRDLETEEKILYNEWIPLSKFIVILIAFVIAILISTVKFGMLNKKTISFDELVACEVIQNTFGKYFGLGVRIGLDKSLAFVTNFGDAVKLTYQENKLFVFSSRNSQEICNQLNDYIED